MAHLDKSLLPLPALPRGGVQVLVAHLKPLLPLLQRAGDRLQPGQRLLAAPGATPPGRGAASAIVPAGGRAGRRGRPRRAARRWLDSTRRALPVPRRSKERRRPLGMLSRPAFPSSADPPAGARPPPGPSPAAAAGWRCAFPGRYTPAEGPPASAGATPGGRPIRARPHPGRRPAGRVRGCASRARRAPHSGTPPTAAGPAPVLPIARAAAACPTPRRR